MNREIRVKGTDSISVRPDTIELRIMAEGVYSDYALAVKKSAEATELLRNYIEQSGLDPKDLKTVHFNIDTEYESYRDENDNWKKRFVGYQFDHRMYIRFPNDNAMLGKVLYQLSKCPVEVEFSINYTVNDKAAVKNELLAKAVDDSKTKAEVLARVAGVQLCEIKSIDYSWGELEIYSEPLHYLRDCSFPGSECDIDGSYGIDIEADDINLQDTVTIVWSIG